MGYEPTYTCNGEGAFLALGIIALAWVWTYVIQPKLKS